MRQHLESLAAHLEGLDSESGDAKAIRWALAEIDHRGRLVLRLSEAAQNAAGDIGS